MAAIDDSPKRRSLRLQRRSNENATPDPRDPEGPPSDRRTSGPRTRLSAGKRTDSGSGGGSSLKRPQRRRTTTRGQRAEDPDDSTRDAAGVIAGKGGSSAGAQYPPAERTDPEEKSPRKTVKMRSQDGDRLTPSMVDQERKDSGEAESSQVSKQSSQENVGRIEDLAHEVRTFSNRRTKDEEEAGPPVQRLRADVEEAGPSGVCNVESGEDAGPSRQSPSRNNENTDPSSPSRRLVCATKSPVRNALQGTSDPAPPRDSKVQCTSKQLLQEVLGMCAEFSKEILEGQSCLNQEQRQQELRNFIMNFETAFQDNVSIDGQSWHEAPDAESEPDIKILEDQLDDAIVDVAMKRKRHPRKILGHFVKSLKLEREILDRYKPVVEPKELKLDTRSESRMTEQTATTASISQQIKETMKALPAQLEKAEGFSQVLNLQPLLQGSLIRQDIFSSHVVLQDIAKTVPKVLETTPSDSEPAADMAPLRNKKRWKSPSKHSDLYPLRSKRKISLEG